MSCPPPNPDEMTPFDKSAITPGSIKRILAKKSSNFSPGDGGITYHHLKKMLSTHHFLATLFSKILLKNYTAPDSWSEARTKLISKGGDDSNSLSWTTTSLTTASRRALRQTSMAQWSTSSLHHSKCDWAWPTTRDDLPWPGKCLQFCFPWVDPGNPWTRVDFA